MSDEGSAGTKGLSFSSGAAIVTSIGKILTIVADLLLIVAMFMIILSKEDCKTDFDYWDEGFRAQDKNPRCCTGMENPLKREKEDTESWEKGDYEDKKTREWKCYPTHTVFNSKEPGMLLFTPLCFAVLVLAVLVMALIGKPESFIRYFSFVFTDIGILVLLIALSFITFPWIKGGKTEEQCYKLYLDIGKEREGCSVHAGKTDEYDDYIDCPDKYFDLIEQYLSDCDDRRSCLAYDDDGKVKKENICTDVGADIFKNKNSYKLHFTEPKGAIPAVDGYKEPVEVDHFWAGGYYFSYFPFWASLIAWVVCLYLLVAAILRLTHILKA